jgi:hypothetical protein
MTFIPNKIIGRFRGAVSGQVRHAHYCAYPPPAYSSPLDEKPDYYRFTMSGAYETMEKLSEIEELVRAMEKDGQGVLQRPESGKINRMTEW